jgi:adenylate kinase
VSLDEDRMTFGTTAKKLKRAARIILVGAPGVGKGTQSERLMKRFPQLSSISTGDLLRDNVKNKTSLGNGKKEKSECRY